MIFRWVLREFANQPRLSATLFATLFLGLLSFLTLDLLRNSIADSLMQQSKVMVAADVVITSRRPFLESESAVVETLLPGDSQQVLEFYSMVKSESQSRLVQIKAIEADFPFYGELELRARGKINGATPKFKDNNPEVWVYPEVLAQLGVKVGDRIKIGEVFFTIKDVVESDLVNNWRGFSLAPRIYLSRNFLSQTKLVTPQSTISYSYLYKINNDAEKVVKALSDKIKDPGVRAYTHAQAAKQFIRGFDSLGDYLGLSALVALFLSGIGSYFLFYGYVNKKSREIAILSALGLSKWRTIAIYLLYLSLLGGAAVFLVWLIMATLFPHISSALQPFLFFPLQLNLSFGVIATSVVVGVVTILASCSSALLKVKSIRASQLFQEERDVLGILKWEQLTLSLTILLLLWGGAIYQARSFIVAGYFMMGLVIITALLFFGGFLVLKLLEQASENFSFLFRQSLLSLSRKPKVALFSLVALGSSVFLLNLIPQIKSGLESEITQPQGLALPGLFLFDIQEEQLEQLRQITKEEKIDLQQVSPMIRARLDFVNGKAFEKADRSEYNFTREQDAESRFRNRSFNLTFREGATPSETVVAGPPLRKVFDPRKDDVAEVSIEKRFMERLQLKMGDVLEFDVQGVPIKGKIVNVRTVRWTSFQPNFFVVFQPGVLEDAPKSYLASIEKLEESRKAKIQNRIVEKLPNISIVDVARMAERINHLTMIMLWTLQSMAALCLLVGVVVVFAIVFHQIDHLRRDWKLLQLVGLELGHLTRFNLYQILFLGTLASLVGSGLSMVSSRIILTRIFEIESIPLNWWLPLITLGIVLMLLFSISYFAMRFTSLRPGKLGHF